MEVRFINNLKVIRERENLSLTEFAENIGISVQRYNAYEKELRGLPPSIAMRVSKRFNVTLDYIYANKLNDAFKK